MYIRNLHEPKDERLEQAARAILAAIYDPLTTQASWGYIHQLNRPAYDRLMRIAARGRRTCSPSPCGRGADT